MIRSLTLIRPGSRVGTERNDATEMKPSRIIIYVVARDVMLLSLCSVEYMMGYVL